MNAITAISIDSKGLYRDESDLKKRQTANAFKKRSDISRIRIAEMEFPGRNWIMVGRKYERRNKINEEGD